MRLIDADQFGVVSFQGKSKDFIEGVCFILDKIYEAPTVEERPHGEWTSNRDTLEAICSVCGEALPYSDEYDYETNFCPNCGADMRVGEAE